MRSTRFHIVCFMLHQVQKQSLLRSQWHWLIRPPVGKDSAKQKNTEDYYTDLNSGFLRDFWKQAICPMAHTIRIYRLSWIQMTSTESPSLPPGWWNSDTDAISSWIALRMNWDGVLWSVIWCVCCNEITVLIRTEQRPSCPSPHNHSSGL